MMEAFPSPSGGTYSSTHIDVQRKVIGRSESSFTGREPRFFSSARISAGVTSCFLRVKKFVLLWFYLDQSLTKLVIFSNQHGFVRLVMINSYLTIFSDHNE